MFTYVGDSSNWLLVQKERSGLPVGNKLYANLILGGSSYTITMPTALTTSTGWFQFAITVDSSNMKMYFNADLEGTVSIPSSRNTSETLLSVGKSYGSVRDMNGEIAIVKVYNDALTENQIEASYSALRHRFDLPRLTPTRTRTPTPT